MLKEISSINNSYIKELAKLAMHKYRVLNKKFLVEGYHLVKEAYHDGVLEQILYVNDEDLNCFSGIDAIKVTKDVIQYLSDVKNPQAIIGVCIIKEFVIDYKTINKVLILDDLSDPGNVGSLIRTSIGFNIDLVLLSNSSVDVYNSKVVRSTQGALFKQKIIYGDILEEIKKMKENNIFIISTSLQAQHELKDLKGITKYAIILGNEANGVKKEIQDLCDDNIIIKTNALLESLNVLVAGSIIMYELDKQE